jgi:hypothetical protein
MYQFFSLRKTYITEDRETVLDCSNLGISASSTVYGGDVRGGSGLLGHLGDGRGQPGAALASGDGGKGAVWRCGGDGV